MSGMKYATAGGWFAVVIWAVFISFLLFHAAKTANLEYYKRWPLQGDTASYWIKDIALTKHYQVEKRSNIPLTGASEPNQQTFNYRIQALHGALKNGRDPARTAFFALLPEGAPYSVNGHLAFSIFTAFMFLLMLMIALRKRTGSFVYAIGASLIPLLPKGLFNPMYGLPSKLPDLPASFLFGAALFAIFSGTKSRKSELIWIFTAGLLLGFAALTRYHVWIYGLFTLGPIALAYGVKRYFNDGRRIRDVVIYPLVLMTGLGIIAGYFILSNMHDTFRFYSIAGYALNATIVTSLQTTGFQLLQYLGIPAILAGALTLAAFISTRYGIWSRTSRWDALAISWALIAYPFLLFIVMRVESIVEQTYYVVPGLMLFFLAPFIGESGNKNNVEFKVFSICLTLVIPFAVLGNVYGYLKSEAFLYPRPQEMEVAKFQHDLAELVAVNISPKANKRLLTIDSNFFYYGRFMEPLIKIKFNLDSNSLQLFQIRQSQWKISYTGNEATDRLLIIKELTEKVDIFMALTKPLPERKMETFVDDYTERMADFVNKELAAMSDKWESKGSVNGPYGEVTVYKNRERNW